MIPKIVSAIVATAFLSLPSFAQADDALGATDESTSSSEAQALDPNSVDFELRHGTAWQCSAHSTHNEWNIYYGERSRSRHQAEHSAVQECEQHEYHECDVHECYQGY